MLTDQRLKIGVAGIGSIGFRHARLLSYRPGVELYLCDPVPQNLQAARTLNAVMKSADNFADLLRWPLDGLVVATPDRFHVEQTVAACQQGIPVLLEKPIAENTLQGFQLFQALRNTGTAVLVGYALRYAECMNVAKRMLDQGSIGSPVSFQIMLGAYITLVLAKNRFSAADRNKLFADYSHEWDYLQWFLGPVRRGIALSHQSGQLELTQNPNVVDGLLELESGITGTVHLDYVQSPTRRQVVLVGDQGTIDIDVAKSQVVLGRRGEDHLTHYHQPEHRDAIMEKQHEHFLEVIRKVATPKVTVEDGVRALAVADALIRSTESGLWEPVQSPVNPNQIG
jgi:predicted dehydrogenase